MAQAAQPVDLCVVGAGPVGIAVALRARRAGLSVTLLDAGGPAPRPADPARFHLVESSRHAAPEVASCEALGGASWWWGGRCVPFDPLDFETRPQAPEARWPIDAATAAPWMEDAAEVLGCGRGFAAPGEWPDEPDLEASHLERWSAWPRLGPHYRAELARLGVRLLLDRRVRGLILDREARQVTGLELAPPHDADLVPARSYVLACGGLGNARLLLETQAETPALFGGPEGPLGRFYMGHLSGRIARLAFAAPTQVAAFEFWRDAQGAYVRRRLTLPPQVQAREGLLNIAFWPDNPPFHDARHGSATLSAVYLALRAPGLGRRLAAEGVRRAHTGAGASQALGPHLRNILAHPVRLAIETAAIARGRFLQRPPAPSFLVRSSDGGYALHYHAEQSPNAQSRLSLGDPGPGGERRLVIDLRFRTEDAASVVRAHALLDDALRRAGRGRLDYWVGADERIPSVLDQAADGFHQMGGTRMGADPAASVVDADSRTHDIRNLHLAGTSILASSSQANPTLLAVALGLRLADHLGAGHGR